MTCLSGSQHLSKLFSESPRPGRPETACTGPTVVPIVPHPTPGARAALGRGSGVRLRHMPTSLRILGLDPGLRFTGWGLIAVHGNRLSHLDAGRIATPDDRPLAERLAALAEALDAVIARCRPDEAAVEETFVNVNPVATLKLGMARGVVLLAPARAGIPVAEYGANHLKKSVVGAGHADKRQVQVMVRHLLPGVAPDSADAADALAVAICHAHQRSAPAAAARAGHRRAGR